MAKNRHLREGLVTEAEIARIHAETGDPQKLLAECGNDIRTINEIVNIYQLPNTYSALIGVIEKQQHVLQSWIDHVENSVPVDKLRFSKKETISNPHLQNLKKIAEDASSKPNSEQDAFLKKAKFALHTIKNIATGPSMIGRAKAILTHMGASDLTVFTDVPSQPSR